MSTNRPERATDDGDSASAGTDALFGLAERIGTIAIPASLALYAIGFVSTTPMLVTAGVPIQAISSQQLIASGVASAVLFGFAYLGAKLLRHAYEQHSGMGLVAAATLELIAIAYAGLVVGDSFYSAGFCALTALMFVAGSIITADKLTSPANKPTSPGSLAALIVFVFLYSTLVYPQMALHRGGGRPPVLTRVAVTNGELWAGKNQEWLSSLCETTLLNTKKSGCRTVYRVHEDDNFMYLAVEDTEKTCEREKAHWAPWTLGYPSDRYCFVRLKPETVPVMEFGAGTK